MEGGPAAGRLRGGERAGGATGRGPGGTGSRRSSPPRASWSPWVVLGQSGQASSGSVRDLAHIPERPPR
eukprot:1628005-Pyramimonas_sp.AAC.1